MKRSLTIIIHLVLGIIFLSGIKVGAETLGQMKDYQVVADGVVIKFEKGMMKLSQLEEGILRVRATTGKEFEPDQSFALWAEAPKPKPIKVSLSDSGLNFETKLLVGEISRQGGRLRLFDQAHRLILEEPSPGGIYFEEGKPGVKRVIPADEHYYGFGEKTGELDKRGSRMVMWNLDNVYGMNSDPLYQSHPYYLALRKGRAYGIFQDNSYRSVFDVGKSEPGEFNYQADGGELNYYFIYGPSPKQVLEGYGRLVGRFPLPPLWALGYMQCRYSYKNEAQVRAITNRFRRHQVPCDVIFLDIHYMDDYKVFSFHPKRFPDPEGLITELEKNGFKTIVIVDPGVKIERGYYVYEQGKEQDYFVRSKDNGYFKARVWPGDVHFPDFLKPEVRSWWGELHKFYLDKGVDGIWNDMNEPAGWEKDFRIGGLMVPSGAVDWLGMVHGSREAPVPHARIHNVYALLEAQGTYEGLLKLKPTHRPFVISRAGYPGLQRYSSVWTGDNTASWPMLRMSLPMLLNLSLSGIPDVGADIGGFVNNPSPELYARWIQQGVFYPFCRTHTAVYHPSQDPFSYGKEVQEISKSAIELRYRLLPYSYTYFRIASESGLPVMRAMLLEFPEDESTYQLSSQFMWGEWLLVAPVIEESSLKKVYLPKGDWYRFEQSERVPGGREITEVVKLSSLPLFVRAGGIIPLAPVMNYTDEKPWAPLTVEFYPGREESCFELYEDQGEGFGYLKGDYLLTRYCQNRISEDLVLRKEAGKGNYRPQERELFLKVFGAEKPERVQVLSGKNWENLAYSYDAQQKILELRLKDQINGFEIRISY